jgi:hypothetical protein
MNAHVLEKGNAIARRFGATSEEFGLKLWVFGVQDSPLSFKLGIFLLLFYSSVGGSHV